MPDGAVIDAHVHLWDPRRFRMPWLEDNTRLNRAFGPTEFARDRAGLDVEAVVYVQVDVTPAYGLLEARWAAEQGPLVAGIVAWAPIEDGATVRTYLNELRAISPRIRGVRQLIQSESDPDFPVRPGILEGLRLLPEYGLSFDICIQHHQLARTIEMVRACPETFFVLDHLGKPNVKDRQLAPWREQISELAELPNVVCKVSGLVTEADHTQWTAADLQPYVLHVVQAFGEDRVLFGGDWPVVTMAASYRTWTSSLEQLTAHLSPAARRKLWADNARRVYRL
ncbi:MAG: amidohydrolase family protein [Chloroflexi bacterium]|nr:amidohydrolase family protein [Chloroflexota bacterium]